MHTPKRRRIDRVEPPLTRLVVQALMRIIVPRQQNDTQLTMKLFAKLKDTLTMHPTDVDMKRESMQSTP